MTESMSIRKKHRFILIGHGAISKSYLNAFANIDNAEIVGVVGRNIEKVKAFAMEHAIPVFGTGIEYVAKQGQATAAVICTPNATHYEGVMAASRLGLHCLCEKPLHISPDKQQEMVKSCKAYGVKLGVSYMRRFISHLRYIKQLVDEGKLGRITVVDVTIKNYRTKQYYDSWHGTNELDGGGPFIQQGSHIIDLAQWICGGYKEVLEAKRFRVLHDIETEDHGYAMVQYQNGAVGMIEASTACTGFDKEMIEISGTAGSISANYDQIVSFEVPGVTPPQFAEGESANPLLFNQLAADFIQAIEDDRLSFIDGESAQAATALITAIYKKAGEPMQLRP
jgi:UDP-N-acetyl-2-amino-2-deoxyglucuronate dehydrogenase